MKKYIFLLGLILFLFLSLGIYAIVEYPRVSTVCEDRFGKLTAVNDGFSALASCAKGSRLVTLGEKQIPVVIPTPHYYLKTSDWFTASPNIATTVYFGCEPGDMAIGGGMDNYSGTINQWRTVRSGPSPSSDMNGWQTTVLNIGSTPAQFSLTAKCLKLNP